MKNEDKKPQFDPQISKEDSILSGERPGKLEKAHGEDKLLKKRKNEPDDAVDNLDIPGAGIARPLTNDRHHEEKYRPEDLKKGLDTPASTKTDKK